MSTEKVIFKTDIHGKSIIGIANVISRFKIDGNDFITLEAVRVKHTPFNYDNTKESLKIVSVDYLEYYDYFTILDGKPYVIPYELDTWKVLHNVSNIINENLAILEEIFQ